MTGRPTNARGGGRVPLVAAVTLAGSMLVVGFLALEAATRVVFDNDGMHYGIEMWKYARHVKQRSRIAALGHEHAPGREATLMGVPVRINSQGLRDREFDRARKPGVGRLMVLGDSMTFGWGVQADETYPKVLERLLNDAGYPAEVINTGVGNYNTSQEVTWFRERGLEYRPDTVILGFYINDAEPTPVPVQNILARHSYFYVLASSGFDAFARRMGWKQDLFSYYDELYADGSPGWIACQEALAEFAEVARRIDASPRVALIPELHGANVTATYPFRHVHRLVEAAAQRSGLPVTDLTPAFAGIDPATLWVSRGDAHPNARAHEIIARSLFATITAALQAKPRDVDGGTR